MNHAAVTQVARSDFATAVRNFTPSAPAKFQTLLPFKEGIAELRRKGASYETIADILRNLNVAVSHDTVTRFCHKVLGFAPAQRRRRKQRVSTVAQRPRNRPLKAEDTNHAAQGPRVADPNNV
jgi:hypothetical protein